MVDVIRFAFQAKLATRLSGGNRRVQGRVGQIGCPRRHPSHLGRNADDDFKEIIGSTIDR
jgi:hypothetical protein